MTNEVEVGSKIKRHVLTEPGSKGDGDAWNTCHPITYSKGNTTGEL